MDRDERLTDKREREVRGIYRWEINGDEKEMNRDARDK